MNEEFSRAMQTPLPKNQLKTSTKDGVPLGVGNIPVAEEMFFYERLNGTVINVGEKDAAKIHTKFKYLGRSDGKHYVSVVKDLQARFQELTMQEIRQGMQDAWKQELENAKSNLNPPVLRPLDLGIKGQIQLHGKIDEIK